MRAFVTGAFGFIGSNLANRLLADGHEVLLYDNLSTGKLTNIERPYKVDHYINGDVTSMDSQLVMSMYDYDVVFHLAAHADVRSGVEKPSIDLEQNIFGTFNVLQAMRINGIKRIVFTSSGSVYGEPTSIPTPEDASFPVQTSMYGASKLAGEGLIQAYSQAYGIQAYILRLVSVLGEGYHHGHVIDFYNQLKAHPDYLDVLGNGKQRKSYVYVGDVVEAMLTVIDKADGDVNIFNVGFDGATTVDNSIRWISEYMGLKPEVRYSGGKRGWIGDSPHIYLDCTRLWSLGWKPTLTIKESVIRTLNYLESSRASA